MSGDTPGCHGWEAVLCAIGIYRVETTDAAKRPTMHRAAPRQSYPVQHVTSAKVRNPTLQPWKT